MTLLRCAVGAPKATDDVPRPLVTAVLRLLWDEEHLSRAEIARRLDISRSTVSEIVDELTPTGLLAEAGVGESRGGRRPIVLQFQYDAFTVLGVDLGATHVSVAATDLRGRVLAWQHAEHPVQADPEGTRDLVDRLCAQCLCSLDVQASPLIGIGMGLPTPVDPRHPERVSRIALARWDGVHGFERLIDRYHVPLLIDNDANLGALAEYWWGTARGLANFTFIKVATGIGAGYFIDGRIYRGAGGAAGEVGHVTIDTRGIPCGCGNRGCLTTYVGTHILPRRAAELLPEYPRSVLHRGPISMASVEAACNGGDPLAVHVVQEAAEHIGTVVAGMLNLMNPAAVIFGGTLCRLGERLLTPIREAVTRRTFVSAVAGCEIQTTALGERGIAIGASTLILEALLANPRAWCAIPSTNPRSS